MKPLLFTLGALTLLLMTPVAAHADGARLLEECGELMTFAETGVLKEESAGASYCLGMVSGMIGLNAIYQARKDIPAPLFCTPRQPVTNAEGARIIVRYLEAHPEQLAQDDISLAYFAFAEAFPCGG
jgi:hypothetical protein